MNITNESWSRLSREATGKFGDREDPLRHSCGIEIETHTQTRIIWDDVSPPPSRHGEITEVGELYCPKCEGIPQTHKDAPIGPDDFFDFEVPIKHRA